MENSSTYISNLNSSPRAAAVVFALLSAVLLSPLYAGRRKSESRLETRWSSGGLVLPVVVAGLIVAIRTIVSSSKRNEKGVHNDNIYRSPGYEAGLVFRIGSSTWGLAGILIMLVFVISWQDHVKHFFWR